MKTNARFLGRTVLLTLTFIFGGTNTGHAGANDGLHTLRTMDEFRANVCGDNIGESTANSPKDQQYLERLILRYRQILNAYAVRNDDSIYTADGKYTQVGREFETLKKLTLPPCLSPSQSVDYVTKKLSAAGILLQNLLKSEVTRETTFLTQAGGSDDGYYEARRKLSNASAQLSYLSKTWTKALTDPSLYAMSKKDFKKEFDSMKPKYDDFAQDQSSQQESQQSQQRQVVVHTDSYEAPPTNYIRRQSDGKIIVIETQPSRSSQVRQ